MNFAINKKSNIQLCEQIRVQLRYQIINGEMDKGSKLPSVRELSSALGINRHTISKAYKELEDEGFIVSKQSLGTFVSDDYEIPERKNYIEFIDIIKSSIDAANMYGFTTEEFIMTAQSIYLQEKNDKSIKGLFVECNLPAVKQYVNDIRSSLGIEVEGCLLSDIETGIISHAKTNEFDIVMTTVGHYPYLRRILKNNENIYAINIGPYLKVLNQIKDLPSEFNLGIVCVSEGGAIGLKQVLIDLGILQGVILSESTKNLDKVKQLANEMDVLVVSKFALEENSDFFDTLDTRIIEYSNVLQDTSIKMLQEVVSHMKYSKNYED